MLTLESVSSLHRRGTDVRSAASDFSLGFLWVCFSPHQYKAIHWENLKTFCRTRLQWQLCSAHLPTAACPLGQHSKIKWDVFAAWRDFVLPLRISVFLQPVCNYRESRPLHFLHSLVIAPHKEIILGEQVFHIVEFSAIYTKMCRITVVTQKWLLCHHPAHGRSPKLILTTSICSVERKLEL